MLDGKKQTFCASEILDKPLNFFLKEHDATILMQKYLIKYDELMLNMFSLFG